MFNKIKTFLNNHIYLRTFLFIYAISFVCFMSASIPNGLTLPMNGDYVLQQLHFYCEGRDAFIEFLKTGEFKLWSYSGFLGVNYFAANTFYYLTSIFSLPIYLTPKILIPQMIFIMFLFKIALGGTLFFYLLRKYYHTSDKTSLIGAMAYSLCGWGMYYLWFNHFHDVLALFPLLLIGVEMVIQEKKGYCLTIGIFLIGLANYYFLFNFLFTTVFYAFVRYFQSFKQNKKHNSEVLIKGAGYALLGLSMAMFVIIPAALVVVDTPRVESSSLLLEFLSFFFVNPIKNDSGYILGPLKSFVEFSNPTNIKDLLSYMFIFKEPTLKQFFYPLSTFFFPPVNNWDTALFVNSYYDNIISSLYISIPLTLLIIPRFIEVIKSKKWFSVIMGILFISLPFIPFNYYLLNAFSQSYGRWFLFIASVLILYTVPLIDRYETIDKINFDISLVVTITLMAVTTFVSYRITNNKGMDDPRYLIVAFYFIYVLVAWYLLREGFNKDKIKDQMFIFVTLDLIVCSQFALYGQGFNDYWSLYGGQDRLNEQRKIFNGLDDYDSSFYRVYNTLANRNHNNIGMTLNYNAMSTFHSVYNYNLTEFLNDWTLINYNNGNWSMSYDEKRLDLDAFLGVKYYVNEKDNTNVPFNYTLLKEYQYFDVYQNNNYIELGFAFDTYIEKEHFDESLHYYEKDPYYTSSAILSQDDINEINNIINLKPYGELKDPYTALTYNYGNNMYFKPRGEEYVPIRSYGNIPNIIYERSNDMLYGRWNSQNLKGDTLLIDLSSNPLCIDASSDNMYHILMNLCYGPNVLTTFYHNDEVIVSDAFGVNYYNHDYDHKRVRGFFIDQPVTKIEIEVLSDAKYSTLFKYGLSFYYTDERTYDNRINSLKQYAFSNIKVSNNTINFDTNYEDDKFIVLNVPYDDGWSLTINGEKQKIYKAQSGFIGFVNQKGNNHISLNYFTPGLKKGLIISGGATFIFLTITLVPIGFSYYRKKKKVTKK